MMIKKNIINKIMVKKSEIHKILHNKNNNKITKIHQFNLIRIDLKKIINIITELKIIIKFKIINNIINY